MVDVPLVLVGLGGILVILGLAGGVVKTKWVEVSSPIGKGIRVVSVAFGILCVASGGTFFFFEKIPAGRVGGSTAGETGGAGGTSGTGEAVPPPDGRREAEGPPSVSIFGRVVDVFDNPREGVIVLARGLQRYGISDDKGRFILSEVPKTKGLSLDAHYGDERDAVVVDFALAAAREPEAAKEASGQPGGEVTLPDPMVLNPLRVEVLLCRFVEQTEQEGLKPVHPFSGDEPKVSYDSLQPPKSGEGRELWCFVRVFGPDRYEVGRTTDIVFEWEWNGEPQGKPYAQSVGVRSFGWRTRVSKKVWEGEWVLRIGAKRAELARVAFEVY
jgi:hypothetical protein